MSQLLRSVRLVAMLPHNVFQQPARHPRDHTRFAVLFGSPWPERIIRWLVGAVFIYAGLPKLLDPQAFGRSISAYDLVPENLLPVVAYSLPTLEILAGLGLIFNVTGSLTVIFGMLLVFVIILWYGILHDLDIDCGCFSTQELARHDSLRQAFRRDLLMMTGLIYVYIWRFVASRSRQRERLSLQEEETDVQR